jgi:hypothetical protein
MPASLRRVNASVSIRALAAAPRSHLFGYEISVFRAFFSTLRSSQITPHVRKDVVLRNAFPEEVRIAEHALRIRVALIRGFVKPLRGLGVVLRNAFPEEVCAAEHALRMAAALILQ